MTAGPAPAPPPPARRLRLEVRGRVQGVGFRPFVWRLARGLGLAGRVANTAQGVAIEVEGPEPALADFRRRLTADAPAMTRIEAVAATARPPEGGAGFEIQASDRAGARTVAATPDIATCPACLAEIRDPAARRYRYPFTNCTDCGPRYSILRRLPYDRANTTMAGFAMCPACRAEYDDPGDRRFHAQPIACPECGPRLTLRAADGREIAAEDAALAAAASALAEGRILALKGLGGYQLLADARDAGAVAALRARKRRPDKPFALMAADLAMARALGIATRMEADLLATPEGPIVLMRRRTDAGALAVAEAVAPGTPLLGVMLPTTPLHHLLADAVGFPLVATSGNRADEPMATDPDAARARLAGIADLFLDHDRPIARPVDDSVVRVIAGAATVLRRGRGYAPDVLPLAHGGPALLAHGGHLKAAAAVAAEGRVVLGPHIGDLDTPEARAAYADSIADLAALHDPAPEIGVCDGHPDYASTRLARARFGRTVAVPHHLAHIAACLAEHDCAGPVLGVAWDGTGDGGDGTVWGGEFLTVAGTDWRRTAHLRPFRLPGGEAAAREPRRAALGLLYALDGAAALAEDGPLAAAFDGSARGLLAAALARGVNAPWTTSAGRLFDGVAALLGLGDRASFEGQAAAALEHAADGAAVERPYDLPLTADTPAVLDWGPLVRAVRADAAAGVAVAEIAAGFHAALARAIVAVARRAGARRVALTGGCFQNRRLTERATDELTAAGIEVLRHRRVPPNDGGLALGQAAWAARLLAEEAG